MIQKYRPLVPDTKEYADVKPVLTELKAQGYLIGLDETIHRIHKNKNFNQQDWKVFSTPFISPKKVALKNPIHRDSIRSEQN
ncbi:MAG: hypothetical protein IPF75_06590 [Bacteroidetes bacterium]|nr:hypothetical protein [Bacteroidota bacterium]